MSLRDSYFNGPNGIQSQMDAAFANGVAYVGVGANDISTLSLGDRNGSNLAAGNSNPGLYFTYATPSANYVIWMFVNGEVAPSVAGGLVQVTILNSDNSTMVAAKIAAAMNAIGGAPFSDMSSASVVTMQNSVSGVVILPISVGTLNYTAASFTGVIAGTSTSVTITANVLGPSGTAVTLAFSGSNSISGAISTWNTANPSNTVTLTSGDGTQVPTISASAPLTGGMAGMAVVAQVQAGIAPTGVYASLQQGLQNAANGGKQNFRVVTLGTGSMNTAVLRASNGNNLALRSFFAGIYQAMASQQIYNYQVRLQLDISTTASTNVIFDFSFARRFRHAPVNLDSLTCPQGAYVQDWELGAGSETF